jgi:hypothetical protein
MESNAKGGLSRKRRERSDSRRTDIAGNGKRRPLRVPVLSNQCRYRRFDVPNWAANDIFSQTRKLVAARGFESHLAKPDAK